VPTPAYEQQGQRRTIRFVDDDEKNLMEQFGWKAGDGCDKMDDARIFVSPFGRGVP